ACLSPPLHQKIHATRISVSMPSPAANVPEICARAYIYPPGHSTHGTIAELLQFLSSPSPLPNPNPMNIWWIENSLARFCVDAPYPWRACTGANPAVTTSKLAPSPLPNTPVRPRTYSINTAAVAPSGTRTVFSCIPDVRIALGSTSSTTDFLPDSVASTGRRLAADTGT